MATPLSTLVADIRVLSGLRQNQLYTDTQVAAMVSDLWQELYDRFVAAQQHYSIEPFDFTLTGGVGNNTVPLPANFYQGNGLVLNPTQDRPQIVPYSSAWLTRFNQGASVLSGPAYSSCPDGRSYDFSGSTLEVLPPSLSAGTYRLYYTPQCDRLEAEQAYTFAIPVAPSVQAERQISIVAGSDHVTASNRTWTFANGRFTESAMAAGVLLDVNTSGQAGIFTVEAVLSDTQIVTFETPVTETFIVSDSVSADDVLQFSFPGAAFTEDMQGGDLTLAFGATAPPNNASHNGTYTLFDVLNDTTVQIPVYLPSAALTLPASGTLSVAWNNPGTTDELPDYADPWAIYIKLGTSIAIREARQQDVSDLTRRYEQQAARVSMALQNRQEEATQPPLTRGLSFWDLI